MPTGFMSQVIRQLQRTNKRDAKVDATDAQLLKAFIDQRDESAFATLVRRHGPMVFGVCQRMLGNLADADDAFQATFLVLVRRAASIQRRTLLANWLYGVACRIAMKARTVNARRKAKEQQAARPEAVEADLRNELLPVLDEEVERLPDKYRQAIVLCELQGKTRKEAALLLRWPEGTVASRLRRGRTLLAIRLKQRGVTLTGGVMAALLAQNTVSATVPLPLVSTTVHTACGLASGQAISPKVAALSEGVLKTMLLSKLKVTVLCLLSFVVVMIGSGVMLRQGLLAQHEEKSSGLLPVQKLKRLVPAVLIEPPDTKRNKTLWVKSKDGKLALRLVAKTAKVKPGHPIELVATLKNLSNKSIHVIRPFGDGYAAQAVGMNIRGRLGKVKYGGPTPGYVIGSSAFTKLEPGKSVQDAVKLDRYNFVGFDIPGIYQIAYQYAYAGEWNFVAKRAGLSTDIWKGNIRTSTVTIEILKDPRELPWVMSKDGTVGIRLSAKTRPLRPGEPIVLTATIRNFSPKTIRVLKPLEFPVTGRRIGLQIKGPKGPVTYVGPKAKPETVMSHYFAKLIPGQKYEGHCHLEIDSYSNCSTPGKYTFVYDYSSHSYQVHTKDLGIGNFWVGRLPKATLTFAKPLFSRIKHPVRPGRYANGAWEYELRIFGKRLKHRQGILKYNGRPIFQPIGTHILTSVGRFMSFATKGGQVGYNRGWHMTVFLHDDKRSNYEAPVFLKNGKVNPEVLKALGIDQTKELKSLPPQYLVPKTNPGWVRSSDGILALRLETETPQSKTRRTH